MLARGHWFLVGAARLPVLWGTAVSAETAPDRQSAGLVSWQSLREPAAEPLALQAARAFAARVSRVAQVTAVAVDLDCSEPRITTYIERRDLEVRRRIYDVEFEICRELRVTGIDFRVVAMDNRAAAIPGDDVENTKVVYRRDSRDHAQH